MQIFQQKNAKIKFFEKFSQNILVVSNFLRNFAV